MSANERVRLAQELHDGIAQDLVGLGFAIDSLVAQSQTPNVIRAQLRELRFATSDLVDKVRNEIFALRTSTKSLASYYETSTEFELKKIFAELLRNIQNHSQATFMTLTLSDNGVGGLHQKINHHGITGISERVRGLDGALAIDSSENGTRISITLPLQSL